MEKRARINRDFPADLLFEILVQLPLESLCRLRCVSKLWRSVIADPRFVEAHRACSRPRLELIILFPGCERVDCLTQIYHAYTCNFDAPVDEYYDEHHRHDGLTTIHELVPNQDLAIFDSRMSHQIGGLYCLNFRDFVRVWNPSTRESFDINTVETEKVDRDPDSYNINLFGFDPVEKKHKVLSLSVDLHTGKAFRSRVFILEENRWRTLADVYPLEAASLGFICVDGVIFSAPLGFYGRMTGKTLVAFHVGSETFQAISLPEGAKRSRLVELSGRATLVECDFPCDPYSHQRISMWMLEDLQVQPAIWRHKSYFIPSYNLRSRILHGGTPTGELLYWGGRKSESFYLLLYNAENCTVRRIRVKWPSERTSKLVDSLDIPLIHFHVESLRSPKGPSS